MANLMRIASSMLPTMNSQYRWLFTLVFLGCAIPVMQSQTKTSRFGFSYTLPADFADSVSDLKQEIQNFSQSSGSDEMQRSVRCIQILLAGFRSNPKAIISAFAIPFDCMGQRVVNADLPALTAAFINMQTQLMDISESTDGAYSLGTHKFWIVRIKGAFKDNHSIAITEAVTCALVRQAVVCWMGSAPSIDDGALQTFESLPVTFEGEDSRPLVPATAFQHKSW